MAKVNLTKAAELANVTRKTLYKHIDSGKLSVGSDDSGNKVIDTTEILRVYGSIQGGTRIVDKGTHPEVNSVNTTILEQKVEFLETQLSDSKSQLKESKEEKILLREEINKLLGILEQNTRLLEHHNSSPPAPAETTETKEPEVQPKKAPVRKLKTFDKVLLISSVIILATPLCLHYFHPEGVQPLISIFDSIAEWIISLSK